MDERMKKIFYDDIAKQIDRNLEFLELFVRNTKAMNGEIKSNPDAAIKIRRPKRFEVKS